MTPVRALQCKAAKILLCPKPQCSSVRRVPRNFQVLESCWFPLHSVLIPDEYLASKVSTEQ